MSNFRDLSQPNDRELSLGPTTANVPVPDSSQSMTPQQEREYVEARWEAKLAEGPFACVVYFDTGIADIERCIHAIGNGPTSDTAWHAAFLFTKERERQIAEVEEEIDLLCKVWPAYYPSDSATMDRIVDVEKARLAELKCGLREVPRG